MNKLLTTLAAGLALGGVAAARTPQQEAPSVVVRYGDLNLDSRAGIARLHARIRAAAESVCESFDSRVLGLREQYDSCVSDAIAAAVHKVGNAKLSSLHRHGPRRAALGV